MKKTKIITGFGEWRLISRFEHQNLKNKVEDIIDQLLKNRGIVTEKQKKEFFNPTDPQKAGLRSLGIDQKSVSSAIRRIRLAKAGKEKVIIFGDYDVDGICSTAILWEYLYGIGLDVTPYIPERFSEGYGVKPESIVRLKKQYPKLSLIITVDNGIVAFEAVNKARQLGIDTIVVDHHEKGEKYPDAYSVVHTKKLCGAGISWVLTREIDRKIAPAVPIGAFLRKNVGGKVKIEDGLELAALGTVADQMPLLDVNRSIVKYGLEKLNTTNRTGLNALFLASGINKGNIGIYEINYVIAPRLNAMGRLEHAIESLRLLCTKNGKRAGELAQLLNRTNARRQKIVEESVAQAKSLLKKNKSDKIIIIDDESYHEGVVGLIAAKLVEEFWRPSVVVSRGEGLSKGSARSIPEFSIIDAIRSVEGLLIGAGGHQMAAGFVLKSENISKFKKLLQNYCAKNLKNDLLEKRLRVDINLGFDGLTNKLAEKIEKMGPFGIGNPAPTFSTYACAIKDVRKVGRSGNHLKFILEHDAYEYEAIFFNSQNQVTDFVPGVKLDIVYNLEENYWNGQVSLQLKVKDIKSNAGNMF
ncbi:MAG: Single-stranded-DNA-specific exonuclease RecJ [Candidatus Woesebacteria bacterium GW2011_GWA1_39_21]|uniref:Single-stranded-DNA-specific exonuclease RecJ n=1 Tax=Candidatus Woesebacteria bacterium GW2011_GWA1_39_21 TaxID=1618550 RepID=A0A0G0N456_9BACT|nr:MAG: Single-stranded-DNA-specific exonuclease RecJ [Candidatus Woesebacteria bacterium GW2011_GWA1_39_21]